jgi:HSP20 family protein
VSAKGDLIMLLNFIERKRSGSFFWNDLNGLNNGLLRGGSFSQTWVNPPINVYVNQNEVLLKALIPGFDPASIELSMMENKIRIQGNQTVSESKEEKTIYGEEILNSDFDRIIELPVQVDLEKAEAKFKNGILSLTLPKAEMEKPKKINVQIEK